MKKIFNLAILFTGLLIGTTSCDLFKVDNWDEPSSQVYGAILDKNSASGDSVQTEYQNGSQIGAYELGEYSDIAVRKTWYIKENGSFRNNLVFPNQYRFSFTNCNFFPFDTTLAVNEGANLINFNVTPYIRISNVNVVYNPADTTVTATFNLAAGRSSVRLASIALYGFTDIHVGENIKNASWSRSINRNNAVINDQQYSVTVDLAPEFLRTSVPLFVHNRNYYFRVAAKGSQSGVGTVRANFANAKRIVIP